MSDANRQETRRRLRMRAAKIDLAAEVALDPDIQPRPPGRDGRHEHVLVTGVTGFLGAFVAQQILEQTDARLYALVRSREAGDGMGRIQAALASRSLWKPAYESRLQPVIGDLSKPRLGLSEPAFAELGQRVDTIYHAGAVVNMVFPYPMLKAANVRGTHELLRLATWDHATRVHMVSSAAIFLSDDYAGQRVREDDPVTHCGKLDYGYVQSKWVADRLAAAAAARGVPVAIYRPTFIGWHSVTGAGNDKDFLFALIESCLDIGCAPDIDMVVNAVPVDYVSQAMVYLGRRAASPGRVFHLVNGENSPWRAILDELDGLGCALDRVSYAEWRRRVAAARDSRMCKQLASLLPEDDWTAPGSMTRDLAPDRLPLFDRDNTTSGLAGSDIVCPALDQHLLAARVRARGQKSPPAPR